MTVTPPVRKLQTGGQIAAEHGRSEEDGASRPFQKSKAEEN